MLQSCELDTLAKVLAVRTAACSHLVSAMNATCVEALTPYFESFTLMDIQLQKADAKPVVSAFHGGWTEADKAALHTH